MSLEEYSWEIPWLFSSPVAVKTLDNKAIKQANGMKTGLEAREQSTQSRNLEFWVLNV
jgi:hypothetical protein